MSKTMKTETKKLLEEYKKITDKLLAYPETDDTLIILNVIKELEEIIIKVLEKQKMNANFWKKEAKRYSQNVDFWRRKFEKQKSDLVKEEEGYNQAIDDISEALNKSK